MYTECINYFFLLSSNVFELELKSRKRSTFYKLIVLKQIQFLSKINSIQKDIQRDLII
jgi:hypothetical protein